MRVLARLHLINKPATRLYASVYSCKFLHVYHGSLQCVRESLSPMVLHSATLVLPSSCDFIVSCFWDLSGLLVPNIQTVYPCLFANDSHNSSPISTKFAWHAHILWLYQHMILLNLRDQHPCVQFIIETRHRHTYIMSRPYESWSVDSRCYNSN